MEVCFVSEIDSSARAGGPLGSSFTAFLRESRTIGITDAIAISKRRNVGLRQDAGIFSGEYASDYYNGNASDVAPIVRLGPVRCPLDPTTAARRNAVIGGDCSPSDLKIAGCWLSASNLITSVTIKSASMTRRGAMVLGQLWKRLPLVWVTKCSMKQHQVM